MPPGFHENGAFCFAKSLAPGYTQADFRLQAAVENVSFDDPHDIVRTACLATGSRTYNEDGLVDLELLFTLNSLTEIYELRNR